MAGGVTGGIWAVVGDTQWGWTFGEPLHKAPDLTYVPMVASPFKDAFVTKVRDHLLEVSGLEIAKDQGGIHSRIRPLPGHEPDDKPFIGFDNLPEPEFRGTGWDDFDWSK